VPGFAGDVAPLRVDPSAGLLFRGALWLLDQEPTALILVQIKLLDGYGLSSLAIGRLNRAEIFGTAHDDDAPAPQLGRGGLVRHGYE
jgi:hypothetical protein